MTNRIRKNALLIVALAIVVMLALALCRVPPSSTTARLVIAFIGYTNGMHDAAFQMTNSSPALLQVTSNYFLISQEGQAFGSGPIVGFPPGNRLLATHGTHIHNPSTQGVVDRALAYPGFRSTRRISKLVVSSQGNGTSSGIARSRFKNVMDGSC